jgi:hypothetical protein
MRTAAQRRHGPAARDEFARLKILQCCLFRKLFGPKSAVGLE